jgi:protein SCO1/2
LQFLGLALLALRLTAVMVIRADTLSDSTLAKISFEQKLNSQITLDATFRDETGAPVHLRDYFGKKPVILVLGYYECPMLCTLVLNGMIEGLQDLKWSIGDQFTVVNVSINPRETSALAAAKQRNYLKRYGRAGAAKGWRFLTGEEAAIKRLADEVGFQYAYDPSSGQYAHASGLVVLTPEGKVARYLFGITFPPKELYAALEIASEHRIGSPIARLILLCFHYNPITGKYGPAIMFTVRLLGAATVLGLIWLILSLLRREKPTFVGTDHATRNTQHATPPMGASSQPPR